MSELPPGCPFTLHWQDGFLRYDFGPDHPFTEVSRHLSVRLLEALGFFRSQWTHSPPLLEDPGPPASREEIETFHTPGYISRLEHISEGTRTVLLDGGDTPGFPGCLDASARIVGGTLRAVDSVLGGGTLHAFQPAGGLHHAAPDRASGFCILNDLAISLHRALEGPRPVERVAYVDVDAHHGDGVMYGFYEDARVLDIDFHQDGRTLFPGTGRMEETGEGCARGFKVNVPLPPLAGDEAFIPLFQRIVPPLLRDYRPGLIVMQTGVDGHVGDPLAHLQYTPRAYEAAVRTVHDLAHELCGGKLVVTGGGGYLASNVTRIYARTAVLLSGQTLFHGPEGPLPEAWREEFSRRTAGEEAPMSWGEIPPVTPSPWTPRETLRVVQGLERALGRELPPASGDAGSSPGTR